MIGSQVFDMILHDLLSKDEAQLLRSVRLFNSSADNDPLLDKSEKIWTELQIIIRKLIWLVQESDPFVVNLKHPNDDTVSIFELQVLYAIESYRCGREKTTIEVLNWWLPSVKIETGICLVGTITHILDEIEIETPRPDRLSRYILGLTKAKLGKERFRVIDGGLSNKYSQTLH